MSVDSDPDLEHLRILSICHYVAGGIIGFFSLFPLLHFAMGVAMVSGAFGSGRDAPPPAIGWFFIIIAMFFITAGFSVAGCVAFAGRQLSLRRGYLFCLIMAGVECAFAPLGTVLGVFTFIVLLRPSVKELFEENATNREVY